MFVVSLVENKLLIRDTKDTLTQIRISATECSTVNLYPSMYCAYKEIISLYNRYILDLSPVSTNNITKDVVKCLKKHNIQATDLIEYI